MTLPAVGGKVTYTYVVSNIGDLDLTSVAVTDDNGTPDSTSDDFGVDCPKTTLVVDEAMTCTAEVTGTTVTTTNIATASGTGGETSVSDTDDATVTVAAPGGGVQAETDVPRCAPDGHRTRGRRWRHVADPARDPGHHRPRGGGAHPEAGPPLID